MRGKAGLKKDVVVGILILLTSAAAADAAAAAAASQDYPHTGQRREIELEHHARTSSYFTGLCFFIHCKLQPRWLLYVCTVVRWLLYFHPLATGILKGKGFLVIWDQKEAQGASFIGTFPSTYSQVEPAGFW